MFLIILLFLLLALLLVWSLATTVFIPPSVKRLGDLQQEGAGRYVGRFEDRVAPDRYGVGLIVSEGDYEALRAADAECIVSVAVDGTSHFESLTEDDPWEPVQRLVFRKSNPKEIPLVKDKMREWLREAAYGQLFSDEVIEAYHHREDHVIEQILSRAARIYTFEQGEVFGFVYAEDFLKQDLSSEWLVEPVLVAGQPFLLGGEKKCLKTAVLCDTAVSLVTATPFLGHFEVPKEGVVDGA